MFTRFFQQAAVSTATVIGIQDGNYYEDGSVMQFLHNNDSKVLFVESNLILIYNIKKSRSAQDLLVAITTYYSAITGSSASVSLARLLDHLKTEIEELMGPMYQSNSKDWLDVCEELFNNVSRMKNCRMSNKILKLFNHVVAHAFYTRIGMNVDFITLGKLEEKKMRPRFWDYASFLDSFVDLFLFLARAGRQAMASGNIDAFFVDGTTMSKWLTTAGELRKHAEFAKSPEVLGMTTIAFMGKLRNCISDGKEIAKVMKGEPSRIVTSMVLELDCALKRLESVILAAKFRRATLFVGLVGDAGVGKSFITHGLFNLYCSTAGIPLEDAKLWPRTEEDKYFSGYRPEYVGVLFDDVGKVRPSKILGVDPSMMYVIPCANNAPFITPQAELCDKGKVPFMSEIGFVTSNVFDYNARYYYEHPSAIFRRIPVRIEPVVRAAYRKVINGVISPRLDENKVPPGEQYPDVWTFNVSVFQNSGSDGDYVQIFEGISYGELCEYMVGVYRDHIAKQDSFMNAVRSSKPEVLCACGRPVSICVCPSDALPTGATVQNGNDDAILARLRWEWSNEVVNIRNYFKYDDVLRPYVERLLSCEKLVNVELIGDSIEETIELYCKCIAVFAANYSKADSYEKRVLFNEIPACEGVIYYVKPSLSATRHFDVNHAPYYVELLVQRYGETSRRLVETFVMDEVPALVASNWTDDSISDAFHDYSNYKGGIRNCIRNTAFKMLVSPLEYQSSWAVVNWLGKKYFTSHIFKRSVDFIFSFTPLRSAIASVLFDKDSTMKQNLVLAAKKYDAELGGSSVYVRALIGFCTTAGFMIFARVAWNKLFPKSAEPQASILTTGRKPVVRENEKVNVWKQEVRNITKLDVHSSRPNTSDELINGVSKNLCFCVIDGEFTTRVLVLDNEVFVVNNHSIKDDSVIEMWLGPRTEEGLNPSVKIYLNKDMVRREVHRDLAFVTTWSLPRRFKDIRKYLPKRSFTATGSCEFVRKLENGEVTRMPLYGMMHRDIAGIQGIDKYASRAVLAHPESPTKSGDCGSLVVCQSPVGTVIAGLHFCYFPREDLIGATPVYIEDLDKKPMIEIGETKLAHDLFQTGKLFTDYHRDGHMMVHGGLDGWRARPKFTGRKTQHAEYVLTRGLEFDPPIEDNMDKPNPGPWMGAQQILANYKYPTHSMNETTCRAVVAAMCHHYVSHLTTEDLSDIHPVPLDVAINGYPGVPNVDAMQMQTSGGYGKRGPKLQFMTEPEKFEEWEHHRRLNPETHKEVQDMRDLCAKGIRPGSIFSMSYKNEMLSKAKVEAKRVRCVYMCELSLLLNLRMSTLGLTRVMVRRKEVFGIAIGLNTHSEEWNDMYVEAQKIPGDSWVAGDFKAFESVLSLLVNNCVSKVFLFLARVSGNFSDEELLIFETLLAEISNATVDFDGTLITLLGGEVSGHQLTTPNNCLSNTFLHCYVFVELFCPDGDYTQKVAMAAKFFEVVFIRTLGDDVFIKVHPDYADYNHTSIQSGFSRIGVTYTMAEKGAESIPFIPISEVTFLKRSFVHHEEFPIFVAALDKKSIYKMLLYTVPSNAVTYEEQMASAMASAQAESFFHGREFFDQIWKLIEDIPKTRELEMRMKEMPRPSWSTMVRRFIKASPKLSAELSRTGTLPVSEEEAPQSSYCTPDSAIWQIGVSVGSADKTTKGRSPEDRIHGAIRLSRKNRSTESEFEVTPYPDNYYFSKCFNPTTQESQYCHYEDMTLDSVLPVITKVHNIERRRHKRKKWFGCFQAGFDTDTITPSVQPSVEGSSDHHEQVAFTNEEEVLSEVVGPDTDTIARDNSMPQVFGNYFNRPILIDTYTWAENGADGFKKNIAPFKQFFNDANMKAKLKGFSLLRCKLKLRFMVNGSPFYYGALAATFTPLNGVRRDTADKVSAQANLVANSQKPHVWITPQNMSTVEMTLPFVWPYPFVETAFATNLDALGLVQFWQFAPLLSANGTGATNVDISVYAWAEDVVLSGASDRPVMQSGYVQNKQSSTKPSATIGSLGESIPILGKAVKAASSIENALGDVASVFGFTNEPNTKDVEPMKQQPFTLASTEISEPVTKLSLQPKQTISIGSTDFGGSLEDPLHIDSFAGRTSYLTYSDWSTTDVPGTIKFSALACPSMFYTEVGTATQHTPMSLLALMHQYWRGDLRYTFKFIRSPYHRGRVAVTWDRGAGAMTDGATAGNPNSYTVVADLDVQDEVSIVIPYQQQKQFLRTQSSTPYDTTTLWSTSATPPSTIVGNTNGVLRLSVLNRLTAPEASSNVRVLVFVNAEPGFQYAAPRDVSAYDSSYLYSLNDLSTGVVQSGYDAGNDAPLARTTKDDSIYTHMFGEKIVSLREQLHRSSLSFIWSWSDGGSTPLKLACRMPVKHLPLTAGNVDNGWLATTVNAVGGVRVNFCQHHPITLITSCFAGYKGSTNVTVNVDHSTTSSLASSLSITRIQDGDLLSAGSRRPQNYWLNQSGNTQVLSLAYYNRNVPSGRTGEALTNTLTNAGMSANLPYYANSGFFVSGINNAYSNTDTLSDLKNDWYAIEVRTDKGVDAINDISANVFYSTGPDFDCVFFVNVPPFWRRSYAVV